MAVKDELFYWLKLDMDFLFGQLVDFITREYGAEYVLLYLKMCGLVIKNGGAFCAKIGEVTVIYDCDYLERELKYFEKETIENAIDLYKRFGLFYEDEKGILHINNFEDMVGCETYWAKKKRETRENRRAEYRNNYDSSMFDNDENNGFVYLVKLDKHYKIGISQIPESRLKEFTLLPYPLEEICIERVRNYKKCEEELHNIFYKNRVRGEWFDLKEEDIEFIKSYLSERKL